MEQESEAIVLEVVETVADARGLLDEAVVAFGGRVGESGVVAGEDRFFRGADGAGEVYATWEPTTALPGVSPSTATAAVLSRRCEARVLPLTWLMVDRTMSVRRWRSMRRPVARAPRQVGG